MITEDNFGYSCTVDPRRNPYTPNAGATPPVLVGRDDQLETFDILLERLLEGYAEQSMMITGLRGVGKTVLLNEFRQRAEAKGWAVVEIEVSKHNDDEFRRVIARETRRALFAIAPTQRWRAKARAAAAALKSFSFVVTGDGALSAGLDVERAQGVADSGLLDADLRDLIQAVGEAGLEHSTGTLFLFDEMQFLSISQLEALIAALHRAVQRQLPVTLVGAGLPQLAARAGEAKSYAERLFKFPEIGRLSDADAGLALTEPAAAADVHFDQAAITAILDYTDGYPYFLQEFGKAAWDIADGPDITVDDVRTAAQIVEEKLDSSFFKVRSDRTTELELAYLRAMAELGSEPQGAADVAAVLERTSQQVGPLRARLIEKGLLYTPEHGYAAFTVPQFDKYMKRLMDLEIPPLRPRRRK